MKYLHMDDEERRQILEGEIRSVEREHYRLVVRGEKDSEQAKAYDERHKELSKLLAEFDGADRK